MSALFSTERLPSLSPDSLSSNASTGPNGTGVSGASISRHATRDDAADHRPPADPAPISSVYFPKLAVPIVSSILRHLCFTRSNPMSTAPSETPTTVSLADEEAVKRILIDTLFGLWATVNNLTRLRPSRRERYRVTVFGSARTEPGHWVYDEVKQMCSVLSAMNCDIITGGGPGLD